MRVAVVGCGYVGSALITKLSLTKRIESVMCVDNNPKALKRLETKDNSETCKINAVLADDAKYDECDMAFIALPTDFDNKTVRLNTKAIDETVEKILKDNGDCKIIIKSTVPIGYTNGLRKKLNANNIFFCPEFIRENHSDEDMRFPSRIVIGCEKGEADFSYDLSMLLLDTCPRTPKCFFMSNDEAEAVKLLSNTYLAMRVAFFNEVDTLARVRGLNTENIIDGICADERIGNGYNNPSFGYGGYCLPKDVKQLMADMNGLTVTLAKAIDSANMDRKIFIIGQISERIPKNGSVGLYRIITTNMDHNGKGENIMLEILTMLVNIRPDIEIHIYDAASIHPLTTDVDGISDSPYMSDYLTTDGQPLKNEVLNLVPSAKHEVSKVNRGFQSSDEPCSNTTCNGKTRFDVIEDPSSFCKRSDVIVANRVDEELLNAVDDKGKIYTADIYGEN